MSEVLFPPTRRAALDRLEHFLPAAGARYQAQRNFEQGPSGHSNVSLLSPYLRHRVIDEREVIDRVLETHDFIAAEKFVDEVFWRTYWKGWLEYRPAVWANFLERLQYDRRRLEIDTALQRRYQDAISGDSGIHLVDVWINELKCTGYLHNHARMWFASMWIFTLGLPWTLGAALFMQYLLDGDPASNTLSWRWVAGLHTPGKIYLATQENLERYAAARFKDAAGRRGLERLSRQASALTEPPIPDPTAPVCPRLDVDLDFDGLLLTEDDLGLSVTRAPRATAVWMAAASNVCPVSGSVQQFKDNLAADALDRIADAWPASEVHGCLKSVNAVVDWIQTERLQHIVMPYVPQGFLRPHVEELQARVRATGAHLTLFTREHDRLTWPYCQKGFFQLKRHIRGWVESAHG